MNTKLKTGLAAAASAALLGATATASAAEYANVVSATPVTNSVAVPRQDCVQSEQVVQPQPSGAGALIGAIAGGVIGNQFGHGFGRAAATGVGAVAGSAIGNNVEANANPPSTVPVRRCRTVNALREPRRRLRRRLRVPRPALHDAPAERPGPAPGDRRAPDAATRRSIASARRRATAPSRRRYAQAAPSYSEVPPAYYDAHRRTTRRAGVLRAGAGLLLGAYAAPYYVAPAAIGLGIGYWVGRTLAPRLPLRLARPSRLALRRSRAPN